MFSIKTMVSSIAGDSSRYNRSYHTNNLRKAHPEAYYDRNTHRYIIPFKCIGGMDNQLQVYLSDSFPTNMPSLTVSRAVAHPFVNGTIVTGKPLSDWTPNSDLTQTVDYFLSALRTALPLQQGATNASQPSMFTPAPAQAQYQQQPQQLQPQQQQQQQQQPATQNLSNSFANISDAEKQSLMSNPDEMNQWVSNNHTQIKEMVAARNQLQDTMRNITSSSSDPQIQVLKQDIDVLSSEARELDMELSDLRSRRARVEGRQSKSSIASALKKKISEGNDYADELAEEFEDGDVSVGEFWKKYTKMREDYYARTMKLQRLTTGC